MVCCNKTTKAIQRKQCPICKQEGDYIHYAVLREVVKKDLTEFVESQSYYACINPDCEVVFFSEDENQFWLIQDIEMSSDFDSVTKLKEKDCSNCKGGCHK